MNQSQIAKKAVRTRKAREAFREAFGVDVYLVVEGLLDGVSTKDIAKIMGASVGSIAAIKANLTRGSYYPYATNTGGTAKLG